MSEQDKYWDFFANDLAELVKKTDKFVKMGYDILETHWVRENPYLMHRTMVLKGKDYSDVIEVCDAPQDEANKLLVLSDGWEIASASVSSKFYRMVKRDTAT